MIRIGRQLIIKFIYICIDVACMVSAIYAAVWVREFTIPFSVSLQTLFFDPVNPFRYVFLCWISALIFLNNSEGLYETKREIFESIEIWRVIKTVIISSLMIIVAIYMLKIENFPRTVLFLVSIFTAVSFSLWRILKRLFVQYIVAQGYNNFNALIIGAGKVGTALAKEIERKPNLGINVVGYLDDYKENTDGKILGKLSDFKSVARKEFVNKIFITIHPDSNVFMQLLEQARDLGIAIRVVPQGFELMPSEFCKYNIGFIPVLEYCDAENIRKQVGKRLFDFMIASLLVVILLPVFLLITVLIKIDSPGPVFYLSKRFGRGGRRFYMFKFRSMVQDAEKQLEKIKDRNEVDGPIFKIKKDPRVTRMGCFLRRYSLDELPQLFNVILGHMSLVGPRPFPINQIQREDISQLRRLEVRPGMTGLWQIRGRSDINFARLVKWDVWYISNWSFWLDINILLQTIPVVVKGKGAY